MVVTSGHARYTALIRLLAGLRRLFLLGLIITGGSLSTRAQVSVTTWRNDIARTGQNLNETILNPSNVNATQFGKLFSQTVDGYVYAQPLYLPNVTISGQTHNVVFVETENDSVYAFDADNNGGSNASPLWFASMLSTAHGAAAGATTVSSNYVGTDIIPQVGITGTPVIDSTTGTLYLVSATQEGSSFLLRLHALDLTSGAEKFGGPVVITASIPGTGNGSSGGTLTFDPEWQNQRPGLLLLNGIVWIGFSSHGDGGPWHGWIFGYNETTLQQTGVFCTSPNGVGSGIWMSGGGLAAEVVDPVNHPFGRMFIPTGNGDFTATSPYTAGMDYGDSILNLDLTNGVPTIQDDFTPMNQANLDAYDGDQASGGLLILPTQTTGNYPHLAVEAGKSGYVYLLNRDNLGGYNPSGDEVAQELPYAVGNVGSWSTAAYWNGTVYYWGQLDTMKAFPVVSGQLTGPTQTSSEKYGYPGANPVISANGSTEGIVWTVETDAYTDNGPAVLQAHDATTISTTLYSSSTNTTRDNPGMAVKFAVPTVVNGKVYVGTQTQLSVYGLLNAQAQAATPVLSPGAETFTSSLTVSMSDATAGAVIYYTLDGSTPTTASAVYTAPITLTGTTTIQAIANAVGYDQSTSASATYVDSSEVSTPVISPSSGIFTQPFSATISDSTSGTTIYYTTDGSTPTASSTQYTAPLTVSSTETLNAIAVASGLPQSAVASASYTFNAGQTGINFPIGFAGTQGIMILNGSTDLDDTRLQLTNGADNEAGSAWYYQPVNIQSFTTSFSFQLSNPAGNGITFAIQGNNTGALGNPGSGLGYQTIPNSLAIKFDFASAVGNGTDSTGLYENGAIPTVPAIDLSTTGINLLSDDTMTIQLAYNGTVLSMTITDSVTGGVYSTSWPVNIPSLVGGDTAYVGFTGGSGTQSSSQKILNWTYNLGSGALPISTSPTFSPPGGTYSVAQSVSIASGSSNATIFYTTDGTTPTTASTVYGGPIAVNASGTLKAIAVNPGYAASVVGIGVYTIAPSLPAPTFSPSPGRYTTAQTVSISDGTAGTRIYYTTNGTTPTTSSTLYGGPITVSASETLEAIAVETGYSNSPVSTATYSVVPVLAPPTFSIAGGTYSTPQTVSISDASSGAAIYYTTNGTTPTTSSALYNGAITISWSQTVEAIAVETGYTNSPAASAAYTINPSGTSYINYPSGGFTANSLSLNYGAAVTGGLLQLTDGGDGENRSAWFTPPVPVQSFITDFTFQQLNASADGMTFAIQNENMWALGGAGGGLAYQGITNSVAVKFDLYDNAGEGSDSTGLYTDGAAPTLPSIDLSSTGINLHSGDLMHAHMVYDGTNLTMTLTDTVTSATVTEVFPVNIPSIVGGNTAYVGFTGATGGSGATQNVVSWSYVSPAQQTAAAPTFSPAAGPYTSAQSVTISDATAGTTIYYTTNGTAPTTSSTVYSGPVTVSASETLQAIAVETGYTNSPVASAAYTIGAELPAPTFSPTAGTYTTAQSVTISDATAGTTLYYTTNGSTPTTSSTLYSGPVTVSASETLEAIAVKTGYSNSPAASAAYTITSTLPAPTFTPPAGTYATSQTVTISDATAGTTLYYTTNGTTPTTSSTLYSGPITVSTSETLEAIAVETGYTNSPAASAAYTITSTLPAPTFTPPAGTYATSQTVTISDATAGTTLYYTTNGTTPTTSSTLYSGPITVSASETLEAIAVKTGYTNSPAASAAYTINPSGTSYINYPSGGFTANSLSLNYGAAVTGGLLQLTDGGDGENRSAWFTPPVPVQSFITDFTFQQLNASADGMTFAIQNENMWALGGAGGGLAYQGITNSVAVKFDLYDNAGEGSDSTGLYTDGAAPTLPSIDLSSTGINLHSGDLMHAHMVYDGTNLTMTLTDTVTSATVTEVFPVNIPSIVGGNTAYVGFTGATGGSGATQNVVSWSYVSPAQQTAAAPTFSPAAGPYTSAQSVTISDATAGTTIYYTTNGTAPTTSSTVYSGPVTVSASETLQAIAVETGYTNSPVASAAYTIGAELPAPTFSPTAGTYTTAQSVTISDATAGTTLYYTTNGSTPTTSSTLYSGPVTVSASETLEAIAVKTGYSNSPAASAAYTITSTLPAPTFTPPAGTYATSQTVTISDATAGTTLYYTTNGTTPTTSSTLYSGPITVSTSETLEAIAVETGYTNSPAASAAYTITSTLPAPTFTPPAGTYATSQTVTISDATAGTTLYYTTNGTTPTTSSTLYSGPITVSASETLEAIAVKTGYTNSPAASAAYTITSTLPAPTFTPPAGTYTTPQSVTISDATAGTTLYYTTNGTTPTTSSTLYSGPITVSASETLQAIAVEAGSANSPAASAAYTITSTLSAPTFSPAAGTYTTAQTVTISDTTAGTTLYYTTNGTPPTTSSTLYSGPITVSASETLEAIAVEAGSANSPAATAVYTINTGGTSYINYPSGGFTASSLSLNYGAAVTGGLLQLTDGGDGENRSAWFTPPVPVQSFTTDFTFQQLNASADGMTFAIQNENMWALGGSGAGLGYQGITNSAAVKFDLYDNAGEGSDSTGLYTDGAAPTLPSVDLSSTGINLHSGDLMHAHMVYDGTNLTMTLTDTVTSATVTEVFPVNIPSIVGGNTAYVGFTGGTGGLSATQNVLSWTYTSP